MDKLQKIIAIILKSPLSEKEKVDWLQKINNVASSPQFPEIVEELACYFDNYAEKYEQEVTIYDKYLGLLEQFQRELVSAQQQPVDSAKPEEAADSGIKIQDAQITLPSAAPVQNLRNQLQNDETVKPQENSAPIAQVPATIPAVPLSEQSQSQTVQSQQPPQPVAMY